MAPAPLLDPTSGDLAGECVRRARPRGALFKRVTPPFVATRFALRPGFPLSPPWLVHALRNL
eukprot:1027294-Pyramimonas_sp.AAC.2